MPCAVVLDVQLESSCRAPCRPFSMYVVAASSRISLGREVGVRAGAVPVALHRLGGRSVTTTSKSSAMRCSSQRATTAGRRPRAAPSGPIWNSHWPGITSALSAADRRGRRRCRPSVLLDDLAAEDLVRRRRRSSSRPAARGSRRSGSRTGGRPSDRVLLLDAEQQLVLGVLLGRLDAARRGCWSGAACRRRA